MQPECADLWLQHTPGLLDTIELFTFLTRGGKGRHSRGSVWRGSAFPSLESPSMAGQDSDMITEKGDLVSIIVMTLN